MEKIKTDCECANRDVAPISGVKRNLKPRPCRDAGTDALITQPIKVYQARWELVIL